MFNLKSTAVFVAALIGAVSAAVGGVQGAITTTVIPLSDTVTYATSGTAGLLTTVGYEVTVTRSLNNTVNTVVFKGSTQVVGPLGVVNGNEKAYLYEVNGGAGTACTQPSSTTPATSITCSFGQMRSGETRKFAVFFKAPVKDNTCFVAGGPSCEVVQFNGFTNYSEGPSDDSTVNDQVVWSANVSLGTANPREVKSALPQSGGTYFTGTNALPSPASTSFTFASKVLVPAAAYGSASISLRKFSVLDSTTVADNETAQLCAAAGNFGRCFEASIGIPSVVYTTRTGPYLTIVLRIDSSEVKSPFRKENVKVYYESEYPNPVPPCVGPDKSIPTDAQRCVADIFRYSGASSNGELKQDVEITIHALENGRMTIY